MMRPRLIPVLLLRDGALVKSKVFGRPTYIGDPINAVRIFNGLRADELVFLDTTATRERRTISLELVRALSEEARMPLAAGGGIRTLAQIRDVLGAGAEKVVLNSIAAENPNFVAEAANAFGSSTIVVCIDVKRGFFGKQRAWSVNGSRKSDYSPEDFARLMQAKGAGEVIVQSIERDGMRQGYDLDLIARVSAAVSIPVIALGGAGNVEHMRRAFVDANATALAAGSMFVMHGPQEGVLINYPTKKELSF